MNTVLITGANRGIGLAHVRRFLAPDSAESWRVCAGVRDPSAPGALQDLATAHPDRLSLHAYDATDLESPKRLAQELETALDGGPLDLVFANAGVGEPERTTPGASAISEAFMDVMRVNALAPLALASALAPQTARARRGVIAMQSSALGSISDNASGGLYAYRASKAALNIIAKSLSVDLAAQGIIVVTLHPGWVKTDMGGDQAPLTPEECAAGQQAVFERLTEADTGGFFNHLGERLPW